MAALEKISTLEDMKALVNELHRLKAKFIFDYYASLQDFSSKKFLPQWLKSKGINNVSISEKGHDVLAKISNSKKLCIVIYDLETPDINGLQFLSELDKKEDVKSKCKIIMLCPKMTSDVQSKILHRGASALVFKPLGEDGLKKAFEKIGLDY
jgi:DNA-binding NtrC family response regulator